MGCDIHAVFQARQNDEWIDVESDFDEPRHYFLFAWLAGVRNGFGFAGIPTHDPVTPISEPRGLPEDFEMDGDHHPVLPQVALANAEQWAKDYPTWTREPDEFKTKWLGDHSHSWLTADEILAAPQPNSVMRVGVIDRELFNKWDGVSQPETWCGGISGPKIVVAESSRLITDKTTHVRVEWAMPGDELDYFIAEIRRLKEKHGEVRMVFGFDS